MKKRIFRFNVRALGSPLLLAAVAAGLGCSSLLCSAQLQVGAGKVDITPDAANLPAPYRSIHDPLYARAILVRSEGGSAAALVSLDLGGTPEAFYEQISQQISTRFHVPVNNIMISATHDHASVLSWQNYLPPSEKETGPMQARQARAVMTPAIAAFDTKIRKGVIDALDQAQARLQPAEVGFGEGKLYLNANRDAIDPKTRQWVQEANLDYPSDKTLAVIVFRKHDGTPIAVYMNYAMHAVTMFLRNEISGDFPGAAAKYVEDNFGGGVVALWTSGSAGDQNPIYRRPIEAIGDQTIAHEEDPSKPEPGEGTAALFRLMFGTNTKPTQPPDPKLAQQSWQIVQAMGTLTGEEAIRVMGAISSYDTAPLIQGSLQTVSCPGRKQSNSAFSGSPGTYEDAGPVSIRVGALRLGDIALGDVDAELYTRIGEEAKEHSPFRNTVVVTLTNGRAESGYIPTDDAFGRYSFEVVSSRLKPGCAEMSIVKSIDDQLESDLHEAPSR